MSDDLFNVARGTIMARVRDNPNDFQLLFLKATEADGALADHDTVAAMLAAAGNTEADFTNYARKTGLTATETVTDGSDIAEADLPDQTFTSAGGATNNTLVKAIVCHSVGAGDANLIPLIHLDVSYTTTGVDLPFQFDANGFYRSA